MTMKRFLLIGAGRQGAAVAAFLLERFENTFVDLLDVSAASLERCRARIRRPERVRCLERDASAADGDLFDLMKGADCVVSGMPYALNPPLARMAIEARTSFCDFGCNTGTVDSELALDPKFRAAGVSLVTDCGLGPGLLSTMAEIWADDWDYESVTLYCGGLPQHPSGVLRYSLTFNVCGLLNEYLDDCVVSRGGELSRLEGLSEVELLDDLPVPGTFEAFQSSGGASIGPLVYAPRGVDYQYKTIRHPGHRDVFRAMWEMGLFELEPRDLNLGGQVVRAAPRDIVGQILEVSLASTDDKDYVICRADVRGSEDGRPMLGRADLVDRADERFTSMVRLTGFPTGVVAAALAGLYDGSIPAIAPGATVQFQAVPARFLLAELERFGVPPVAITAREREL